MREKRSSSFYWLAALFGLFGNQQWYDQQQPAPRPRRVDPDYFFSRRQYN